MASELAKAYVQIIPSSQGLSGKLEEMLGGEADKAGASAGSKIGNGIAKGIGLASAAIGAASAAVGSIGKQAIEAYADYEQLTGGVETLFETSSKQIGAYVENIGTKAFASLSDDAWEKLGQQVYDNAKAFKDWDNDVGTSMDAVGDAMSYGLGTAAADIDGYTKHLQDAWGMNAQDAQTMADAVSSAISSNINDLGDYADALSVIPDATEMVMEKAANAYKTAGLSTNEYMETVTSFSAALIQSLGGDTIKAAEMADMAITDMADNANKMGSAMSSIQTAYQGFSKQNYTMLDNLKLGYGGTAAEMFRLMSDAAALNEEFAKTADFSLDAKGHLEAGYADIVQAIHIVQTEMNITGTTAKEASSTISGSIASMKASWQNLITGIADDNADFGTLISNFVDSAGIAFDNLLPRIGIALEGVGKLVTDLAPIIIQELPKLISAILPSLIKSGATLLGAIAEGIISVIPTLIPLAQEIVSAIAEGLTEAFPQLAGVFEGLETVINGLFGWIIENGDLVLLIVTEVLGGFLAYKAVTGIMQGLQAVTQAVATAQTLLNAVMALNPITIVIVSIGALIAAFVLLWNKCEEFRNFWINLWEGIKSAFQAVWNVLVNFFTVTIPSTINSVVQYFSQMKAKIADTVNQTITNFVTFFSQLPGKIATIFTNLINKVVTFKNQFVAKAVEAAKGFFSSIVDNLSSLPNKMLDIGSNIVQGLKNGISNAWNNLVSWFKGLFGDLTQIAKDILGIASPSKVFESIGENTVAGFDKGMEDFGVGAMEDVQNAMDEISGMSATVDAIGSSATLSTDVNLAAPSRSADMNAIESLLQRYLPMLENGTNVNVSLQGDAQGLFRQVRKEVNQFTKSTGNSPFIAPA